MPKSQIPPSEALYPVPVVLVSCLDRENDRANIITIAWCGTVASNPPQLGISIRPSRHSHSLIKKEGQFVVNVPSSDILRKADICGIKSGRDIDKFKHCSFTPIPSTKIDVPMIKECPVNMECVVKDTMHLGSHDMFIGEIVCLHVDKGLLDRNGRIDYHNAKPIVFNGGEYWDLGKKVGFYGFSQK